MAAERIAPAGQVWLCMMCGKTAKDCYGEERGWDESCAINCLLVDGATKQPTEQQAREFHEERELRLVRHHEESQRFLRELQDGTWRPDPELLALAEQVIGAKEYDSWLPISALGVTVLPRGYQAWGTDCQPSEAPGAWTCKGCGFRGFWLGGPHCGPSGVTACTGNRATCRDPMCDAKACETAPGVGGTDGR